MSPELKRLVEAAKDIVMTPEQERAQMRSFEVGQLMLDHPDMIREEAERIVDRALEERG